MGVLIFVTITMYDVYLCMNMFNKQQRDKNEWNKPVYAKNNYYLIGLSVRKVQVTLTWIYNKEIYLKSTKLYIPELIQPPSPWTKLSNMLPFSCYRISNPALRLESQNIYLLLSF